MNQRINVVVSSFADNLLKEMQPDAKFYIFNTIQQLSNYIDQQPIRAQKLYFSRDVIVPATSTSLNYMAQLLQNPFLSVDSIYYITEEDSPEIMSVNYLIEQMGLSNWSVVLGTLNREYITSYISGNIKSDDVAPIRKAIYRMKKSDYVRNVQMNADKLDEDYMAEEDYLSDIPEEVSTEPITTHVESICHSVIVSGIQCLERTMFTLIMAQYLAFNGKTIVIEHDYEYLTLTDLASKAKLQYLDVDVKAMYEEMDNAFQAIKDYPGNLIIITCHSKADYNYGFICNLLYNNLVDCIDYMVFEQNFSEIASTTDYVVAVPNNICDLMRTIDEMPDDSEGHCRFAIINDRTIGEISMTNNKTIQEIISELLNARTIPYVQVINFNSLKIGGEAHDLRMLIN